MKGRLIIIPPAGAVISKEVAAPPALADFAEAGVPAGYLEIVPGFNAWDGQRCVAFCDEEGKRKGLSVNERATMLWYGQLSRPPNDVLVGPVVVVTGDAELMEEL